MAKKDITKLRNVTKRELVFNLPHASFCGDGVCSCQPSTRRFDRYNYQDKEHVAEMQTVLICESISWLGGETKDVDPRVLNVMDISEALVKGSLRKV